MHKSRFLLAAALLLPLLPARADFTYTLDEKTGRLSNPRVNDHGLPTLPNIPAGVVIEEVTSQNGKATPLATSDRFTQQITTRREGDALILTTEITDTRRGDSAADVYFQLPLPPDGALIWPDLIDSTPAAESIPQSRFPIAVLTNSRDHTAFAVAITPETPAIFSAGYSKSHGLHVQAKVGFSDATSPPSRTRLSFALYPIDPAWAFRSAIDRYYRLVPTAYERRATKQGLWLFHGNATTVTDPTFFTFHTLGELGEAQRTGKLAPNILTPDQYAKENQWGIELYPYSIPGQRECGFQPNLKGATGKGGKGKNKTAANPEGDEVRNFTNLHYSTEEALAVLNSATEKNLTVIQNIQPLPAFRQTVRNSALYDPEGQITTLPRTTKWAGLSLTFPTNPNPFIPGRETLTNTGSLTLDYARDWFDRYPFAGLYIDSLYRWGNFLNYRRDHFPAARYGLTYGPDGRPCLSNNLEHLTFLDELGKLAHPQGKKVFANGVRDTAFFSAHRLDVLGSEFGTGTNFAGMTYRRVISFQKPYAGMNHGLKGNKASRAYLARCFLFGLYGCGEADYYASPDYLTGTRDLYTTYLPLMRDMNQLGWQPITYAHTPAGVRCERFGQGPTFYFTLYAPSASETSLTIDLAPLNALGKQMTATDPVTSKSFQISFSHLSADIAAIPISPDGIGVVRIDVR